jgi:hypothetical protein
MRVTSVSWDGEKVLMRDQVLEVRYATSDGRLHIARKFKQIHRASRTIRMGPA